VIRILENNSEISVSMYISAMLSVFYVDASAVIITPFAHKLLSRINMVY